MGELDVGVRAGQCQGVKTIAFHEEHILLSMISNIFIFIKYRKRGSQ